LVAKRGGGDGENIHKILLSSQLCRVVYSFGALAQSILRTFWTAFSVRQSLAQVDGKEIGSQTLIDRSLLPVKILCSLGSITKQVTEST
jgi:hypothetical protein